MITKTMIRHMAGAIVYQRGMEIFRYGKVRQFSCEEVSEATDRISAMVKGSRNNLYRVTGKVYNEFETVADLTCECQAYQSYDGLCKHCVAVLLEYESEQKQQAAAVKNSMRHQAENEIASIDHEGTAAKRSTSAAEAFVPDRAVQDTYIQQSLADLGVWKGMGDMYQSTIPSSDKNEEPDSYTPNNHESNSYTPTNHASNSYTLNGYTQNSYQQSRPAQTSAGRQFVDRRPVKPQGLSSITTPAMKQLMEKQTMRKLLPIMNSEVYGKVKLEPYLNCEGTKLEVEFRIGITKLYIMKDVFAFVESMRNGTNYKYGQKLEFVHTMTAFEPESVPMVRFLMNWVLQNRDKYTQLRYSYTYTFSYSSYLPKLRQIPLTSGELQELVLALGDRSIMASINYNGEQYWQVTQEPFRQKLVIKRIAGGILLETAESYGVECPDYIIYFEAGKIYLLPLEELTGTIDFMRLMSEQRGLPVKIGKPDIPGFCRELLPVLRQSYECETTDFNEEDYGASPVKFKIYLDAPEKNYVTMKLLAVYAEQEYALLSDQSDPERRDLLMEAEAGKLVTFYGNAYDERTQMVVLNNDEDKLYALLTEGVARFQELGEVFVSDTFKRISVLSSPKMSVGVSISGGVMELTMISDDISKEQLIELLSKYDKKKKFFRLKSGEFISTNESLENVLTLRRELALTDKELKKETVKIPAYRALYLDDELQEEQGLDVRKSEEFHQLIQNVRSAQEKEYEIPFSLEDTLREYQKKGFQWIKMLKENGFGGILADDMGLGKTLQVICFLLSEYQNAGMRDHRRCLIVSPASLVYNWESEIRRFAPVLPVRTIVGMAPERAALIEEATDRDILLTSYDLLRRDAALYDKLDFYCEVIDEAQYIKNHTTQAAKAVKSVHAQFRLALTGTPVENRLSELWSIFDYLMPGFLYSYPRFREELEIPIVQNADEEKLHRLQRMIRPFVLRRLKKEVLTDLPDKLEENMYAKMEGEQQKLYDAHVKRLQLMLDQKTDEEFKKSKIQVLSELTKLRQLCCDPALLLEGYDGGSAKIDLCMNLILNAAGNGHKILLFSQFTSMLELLQEKLREEKISFYVLTGATSKEKRRELVDAFNSDDTSVFCISLKAGGTGLNLTAADIVIHYDPWWNVAVQNQATDRAHRIGQQNTVNVYRLITKGTIEENIVKLQDQKKELADKVLSGDDMGEGSFSKDELLELLRA